MEREKNNYVWTNRYSQNKSTASFNKVGGLNPIQIKIKDNTGINILKRYKNVMYKITPLGLLFPATMTNNTQQTFVLTKNLNGVNKGFLNDKFFNIIAEINLQKINKWKEVKGQSIWTNVEFKSHKEINSNSHLCFPFTTRSFNDLTRFSIFLQDDSSKKNKV